MTNHSNEPAAAKGTIRSQLLAVRRSHAPAERAAWSRLACERLLALIDAAGEVGAGPVAAYASFGTEPDTGPLLAGLLDRGIRILLPILENDMDLAWGWYSGPDSLVRRNTPGGERLSPIPEPAVSLGKEAVLKASVVVVPGLAVSSTGVRMGRGGGSYDRVLARLAARPAGPRPLSVALLYPGEVGIEVPREPHDLPVDMAVTADGVHRWR